SYSEPFGGYNKGACWGAPRLQGHDGAAHSMGMQRFILSLWLSLIGLAFLPPAMAADRDPLAEALALPTASGLVGAADAPRFAWIETAAGVRNIQVATRGQPARRITTFVEDDGLPIYDLAFSRDGA